MTNDSRHYTVSHKEIRKCCRIDMQQTTQMKEHIGKLRPNTNVLAKIAQNSKWNTRRPQSTTQEVDGLLNLIVLGITTELKVNY